MKAVLIAAVVSLVVALLGTPMLIKVLVRQGYGQFIRDDGPTSHHTKRGTPTMGGLMILTPEAELLGVIETGGPVANCVFGDRDGKTLYLTSNHIVARVRTKTIGLVR